MKAHHCEKEQEVVAAVLRGSLHEELLAHAAGCDVCAEVMLVAGILNQEIATAAANSQPPDAAYIWRRGQDAARQQAVAKATAPIRIARICATIVALVSVPWLAPSLSTPPWIPDLGTPHLPPFTRALSAALTPITFLSLGATLICMLLTSWYVLRQE